MTLTPFLCPLLTHRALVQGQRLFSFNGEPFLVILSPPPRGFCSPNFPFLFLCLPLLLIPFHVPYLPIRLLPRPLLTLSPI